MCWTFGHRGVDVYAQCFECGSGLDLGNSSDIPCLGPELESKDQDISRSDPGARCPVRTP
jgi:hypothetical protein